MEQANIFHYPASTDNDTEIFESLLKTQDILIERIISTGQTTPEGEWYDQERDEWVLLLQGKSTIQFEDAGLIDLKPGDYLFIPAHQRHRVVFTQQEPPCIWLAIHGCLTNSE